MTITIRPARPSDAPLIADFNARMARETENLALDPATLSAGVRAVLGDAGKGIYYAAEAVGRVVGQLLITHEWSDWRNGVVWWMQSVYVVPDYRRRGVFRALYQHVANEARRSGVVLLRLYVHESNSPGQCTYRRLGMHATQYRVMEHPLKDA